MLFAPAGMDILCIALRYNGASKSKNHKSSIFIMFFNKTRALVVFPGF